MSLLGIKLNVTDSATALTCKLRLILYQSDLPIHELPVEMMKPLLRSTVQTLDIWWASKPYLRIIVNPEREELLLKQYRGKRFKMERRECPVILIDLCKFSQEPIGRFMRAKDLDCSIDQLYFTENQFTSGHLLDPM